MILHRLVMALLLITTSFAGRTPAAANSELEGARVGELGGALG